MSPILQGLANGSVRGYGGYLPLGPSGAFESIASATGTGSSGTITFSSIPSTYQSLQIRFFARKTTGTDRIRLQFNSDTGSNYAWHFLRGDGAVSAAGGATQTLIDYCGYGLSTTDIGGVGIIDIHDYASTTRYKTVRTFNAYDLNAAGELYISSGLWMSTSAISSITITLQAGNFATTSTFALYGIKGA